MQMYPLTHGSLFSGIGGFDLAAEVMGWDNLFNCEIDPFCRKILSYYYPNAQQYHDIRKTDFTIWRGRIDVLSGGFPCQPYSTAGLRKGKEDERHLWPEMLRAIREVAPRWVVGENVYGLVNWSGEWFSTRCVLTWKMQGTKSRRILFRLAVSTLRTEGTASGLLLTPTVVQNCEHPDSMRERAKRNGYQNGTKYNSLTSQIMYGGLLLTPTVTSISERSIEGLKKRKNARNQTGRKTIPPGNLSEQINLILKVGKATDMRDLLPTPNASEATKFAKTYNPRSQMGTGLHVLAVNGMLPTPVGQDFKRRGPNSNQKGLPEVIHHAARGMLPTPTAMEDRRIPNKDQSRSKKLASNLGGALRLGMLPTPTHNDGPNSTFPPSQLKRDSIVSKVMNHYPTGTSSQLNPLFVAEMMSFPVNWTVSPFLNGDKNQSKDSETPLSPK